MIFTVNILPSEKKENSPVKETYAADWCKTKKHMDYFTIFCTAVLYLNWYEYKIYDCLAHKNESVRFENLWRWYMMLYSIYSWPPCWRDTRQVPGSNWQSQGPGKIPLVEEIAAKQAKAQ